LPRVGVKFLRAARYLLTGNFSQALLAGVNKVTILLKFAAGREAAAMSFVLLVVGLLAAAIGAAMVGFGIPINEFSLGNTLIISGTTALMGGLIVIGLALALRQLTRLAIALEARPVPARPVAEFPEPPVAAQRAPTPRMPTPVAARTEVAPRPPRASEVRPAPEPAPLPERAEPAMAPRTPARSAPPADQAIDMPSWRPPRPAAEAPARRERLAPPVTVPERRGGETAYDAIWPADNRVPPVKTDAPEARSTAPEVTPPALETPARQEPVSVLKSGVVDGMAYTLYTDGSIEAELPEGVVRFGSIEELRNHLEKNAS
jgi:hypothetical protein